MVGVESYEDDLWAACPVSEQSLSENDLVPAEKITEWLIEENRYLGGRIAQMNLMGERILGAVVALVALTATVAIANGKTYLVMGLPFLLTIVLGYVLFIQSDLAGLGAYKAALEGRINKRCSTPVAQWESLIVAHGHNRVQTRIAWLLIVLTMAVGSSAAILAALQTDRLHAWGHGPSHVYLIGTAGEPREAPRNTGRQ